ncbi:CvpA family protein [Hyphomonas johnsonii]|jgi:membrane protein required for colicin V production|uniref:CvpA family protein n=1 Tax=Hyphomonas johnsonii MHS-2 TaxID=1280950 RepID=A0A059FT89_9PROT|nr:CvpA family protein [Hyphomonas johnsonii]KCZ93716.1 CvpA family protein [Hyphomonas johnsonii MHS-2]
MLDSVTAFDAIAVAVIVISAIMAFARGFLRELATLGAFIGALTAAFYARKFLHDPLQALLPEGSHELLADGILVVGAFIVVYVLVAWFGQRLSKNIQGADGIGMFDHFAGLAFGVARGIIALVFFVVLLHLALDESRIPAFIQNAAVYPALSSVADYVNENATKVGQDARTALPSTAETGL